MKLWISLFILGNIFITQTVGQKSFDDAKKIIQDYVKSYGAGKDLCDKYSCCTMSNTESCSISKFPKDQTTMVLPGGESRCIFSDSTPFAFQVVPGDSDKVLVYFQGGGACWDEMSTNSGFCSSDSSPQSLVGLFDRNEPKNEFSSFTVVHISYCSGDLFGGNTTRPYTDKKGQPVVQMGLANAQSAVNWVKAQMTNGGLASTLNKLVIGGCSAGSIGAQLWAGQIIKELSWKQAAIIPDSYAGVFPDNSQGALIYDFGYCTSGFLNAENLQKCNNKQLTLLDINLEFIAESANVPYHFIQSKTDIVQQSFYIAVAATTGTTPTALTPTEFYSEVNEIFGSYNKGNQNFVTYLVDGDQHCFTPGDVYYEATTKGPHDNGKKTSTQFMYDWVNHLPLAESSVTNTRCDDGGSSTTLCSADVSPKQYTEHY